MNRVTERDLYSNATLVRNLVDNDVHDLINDDERYKFEHDALRRVRKILDQSDNEVAEFWYDAFNRRIEERYDWDKDGSLADEKKHHNVYDRHGRLVAVYFDEDTDDKPKMELLRAAQVSAASGGGSPAFQAPSSRGRPRGVGSGGGAAPAGGVGIQTNCRSAFASLFGFSCRTFQTATLMGADRP